MLRVLVTGGEGSLGRQVTARFLRAGYDAVEVPPDDVDVLDPLAARRAVRRMRPEVVLDCAFTARDAGELARGAANLAHAAHEWGAHSLYLSSVEVFDGEAGLPYVESDTPRPVTPLGTALRASEKAVAEANHRHAIIRSGALFGYGPGDLADSVLAAAEHTQRPAFDAAAHISPAYSLHVADAAVSLVRRQAFGVFHVPGGGSCSELQFARAVLRMTGNRAEAVAAEPGAGLSPGPNMTLASCRAMAACPDWRIALQSYIQTRQPVAEEPEGIHP